MKTISEIIESKSAEFIQHMQNLREDVKINRTDSRIASTITWLLANQNKNDSWGNDNIAVTSLVMISLSTLLKPASGWNLEQEIQDAIGRASNFLVKWYDKNSYEFAVWDTSIAIRALIASGSVEKQFISDRIKWLLNLNYNSINAGPHHWAQRTLAFLEYGVQKSKIKESILQIVNMLDRNDYYSPYVYSQCLEAIIRSDAKYNCSEITNILLEYIKKANLDSANFINICTSLHALYPILNSENEHTIRLSVSSLFGETCFRENGTWYSDELSTAWALIALTRFSKEVVIRVPKNEIVFDAKKLFEDILNYSIIINRRNFRIEIFHLINMLLSISLITFFITYTTLEVDLYEWLKWFIPTIFLAQIIYSFQYYIRKYSKISK